MDIYDIAASLVKKEGDDDKEVKDFYETMKRKHAEEEERLDRKYSKDLARYEVRKKDGADRKMEKIRAGFEKKMRLYKNRKKKGYLKKAKSLIAALTGLEP